MNRLTRRIISGLVLVVIGCIFVESEADLSDTAALLIASGFGSVLFFIGFRSIAELNQLAVLRAFILFAVIEAAFLILYGIHSSASTGFYAALIVSVVVSVKSVHKLFMT